MCRPKTCRVCRKATWTGCGQHVQQVMARFPQDERCTCTEEDRAAARSGSFWSRLLGG
jgi:hypothetical protein